MPAVSDPFVRPRQTLSVVELRDEAKRLYAEQRPDGMTQARIGKGIGTTQSAVSAAFNAADDEVSQHAGVLERAVNFLDPKHSVVRVETVVYRVERKDRAGSTG